MAASCTKCVPNSLVRPFSRPILMRGIGASELDNIPEVGERLMNFTTFPVLTSSIHTNMSIWTSGGIVGQP